MSSSQQIPNKNIARFVLMLRAGPQSFWHWTLGSMPYFPGKQGRTGDYHRIDSARDQRQVWSPEPVCLGPVNLSFYRITTSARVLYGIRQCWTFGNVQYVSRRREGDRVPVKPFAYCRYRSEFATDRCTACGAVESCPVGCLDEAQKEELKASLRTSGPYEMGERIHRRGSRAAGLSIVESGAVKLETYTRDGRRIVNGFHFAGDLVGGDSIGVGIYPADVFALEETRLCTLAAEDIERLCGRFPGFQRFLLSSLSNELRKEKYVCTSLRQLPSVERTLAFLHDMKARFGPPNRTAGKLCLPMKKQDIAAYLGLTSETLSRNLKYLERQNIIQNAADGITLLQRPE